jgi:hypothetical protein
LAAGWPDHGAVSVQQRDELTVHDRFGPHPELPEAGLVMNWLTLFP